MNANIKIKILIIACVLIVSMLSLIQFYLVKNTYQLTREQYYAAVKSEMNRIIHTPLVAASEEKTAAHLKQTIFLYTIGQINRKDFLKEATIQNDSVTRAANQYFDSIAANNPLLKGTHYQSRYDEIVLNRNGKEDTLLKHGTKHYVYIGQSGFTADNLLLNNNASQSIERTHTKEAGKSNFDINYTINLEGSRYLDVSVWKQVVLRRMFGMFLLAAGLLIAVILLFYQVFRTMLKQKKIAEIQTDFANNITHELKTPLSSVSVILKTLERREIRQNPALLNELLQSLQRQQTKINDTVDSVLESMMQTDPVVEKTNVNITDYLLRYTNDLLLASHSLTIDIQPDGQMIKTHLSTLEKALNNLVDNAVKYSPEGSPIIIEAGASQYDYLINITDQGCGIELEEQSRIFDKFYRIPEQNRHTVKGLGLGLYISNQAINQLGGSLTLKSRPGEGSTFTIRLPIYEN
ncbi:His Kinase A (phospho-acceptor) domain-containing protein [Mucilaginibacter pineti]|uniref:histidine kinase n=1 Tax=Mucilaginibacter pineti TaxID=1391627 RepID=A0A1G7H2J3_9SPHI|nr:HAMP domain-containing sensor histidine kinase [Mucilaginibacter pineti]SDE94359.1 His Kinase A (phospho-acceptor) domain-containing protein [Mucilaginibacter pineti]